MSKIYRSLEKKYPIKKPYNFLMGQLFVSSMILAAFGEKHEIVDTLLSFSIKGHELVQAKLLI
jgi:hypothetical protein